MGNKHSCCFVPNAQKRNKKHLKYRPESGDGEDVLPRQPSSANLPHISEREPDDTEGDPSLHPAATTMFIVKSVPDLQKKFSQDANSRRRSQYQSQSSCDSTVKGARKCSSCSTIFIDDSTVSQPNHKNTVKAVSLAIYFHIRNREQERLENHWDQNKILDIFDEKQHPLSRERVPNDYDKCDPDRKTIYRFVRTLFSAAQLTAECAIVTLVYLERLLTYAEVQLQPSNWKRITLGAILMASKVWDDQAVWNVDYCQILKDVTVEDMNELERQFLELLQFNINVPSSVYAKYYFDLRALADHHELAFPSEPLSRERAIKLEAISSIYEDKLREKMKAKLKRSNSLDGLTSHGKKAKAILS